MGKFENSSNKKSHALYRDQAICCSTDALQGYALDWVPQWNPVRVAEIKIDSRFNSILVRQRMALYKSGRGFVG